MYIKLTYCEYGFIKYGSMPQRYLTFRKAKDKGINNAVSLKMPIRAQKRLCLVSKCIENKVGL